MRKRQKRLNPESAQAGSRAGSVAPGTPGAGAAPEETAAKAPSKKELKKGAAAARLAEASSTASTNLTLSTLMGGFGRKKKEYSWLQKSGVGGGGSSSRAAAGETTTAAAGAAPKAPEKTALTPDPRLPRLGTWREDKEKGKNVQLRDWVTALEMDGIEPRAIQDAYLKLDSSGPRDRG